MSNTRWRSKYVGLEMNGFVNRFSAIIERLQCNSLTGKHAIANVF